MASLERDRVPSPRPLATKETQLIDRIEDMRLLREAADRAVSGEGGVFFLYGEAGIGKTRLTRELGAYARLRGMRVLYGRCPALFRMDGVPPYVLWSEVIKDYLQSSSPEQLYRVVGFYPGELSKLVPEIRQKLGAIPESLPISPEHGRDRLFEAVSQFVINISKEGPLLVILDDLQWTDQSSLLLLHYLARGVYREPLLLLGAYRDTDVDEKHPLSPVLTELNRERLLQSTQLKRMSFDDTSEMIKRILEQDDVPKEFCEHVFEKMRGNPFFTEEVIKSLKEEEVIYREGNKWKIKDVSRIEFPKTVKGVIKTRVSRLDDECQNVLTLASFVGNDFSFEALCGVTGLEENMLLEIIEKMLKTELIKETVTRGQDVYCFADVIVRDVVHEEVSHLRHKKLHSAVGSALEKTYAKKIDDHLGELAYHFLEGGDEDKALDYFLKAGEKAAKIYANDEAVSYFKSAFKLLEEKEGEPREKGQVLERLGDIKRAVGEYDICIKYWNDTLVLWTQLNEKVAVARLHHKLANAFWEVKREKAKEHYDQALKLLETEPEGVELASLYSDKARALWHSGEMTDSLSLAEKALELAKRLKAFEVIASSYTNLALVFESTGDMKKAVECLEKALKISLDNGYAEAACRIYNNLAVSLPAEENERIFECVKKGFELAKRVGCVHWISWLGVGLAYAYAGMGDMDKAVPLTEESVALNRKTGSLHDLCYSLNTLGLFCQCLGEWNKSEQFYKEALSISQEIDSFNMRAMSLGQFGWFYFERGEYDKAKEFFEKMVDVNEKAGAKAHQIGASGNLVLLYIELGEIAKANNILDRMQKFAYEVKNKFLIAMAESMSGMLFRAQKRWEESINHFEKSLKEWESIHARQWWLYYFARFFLFEYARMYLERDQPGDREKAGKLLNQALEMFQKMGAKNDIEKVESRMAFIETGKVVSKPKPIEPVPTGYADLDELLYGGLPSNCAVVLTSPSCSEKDTLVKSFLETGAQKGEVAFYVTINPGSARTLADEYQSNFYLFVCNPQADAIIEDAPNVVKLKGVENLTDISIALTSAIRKFGESLKGPRRICIGLVSDVLLQHHAVQTRRWLAGLIPELQSEGFTSLATMNPEMHPSQELQAILDLFEGEISISEKETEKGLEKFLRIKKMSNQKYLEDEIPLKKEQR